MDIRLITLVCILSSSYSTKVIRSTKMALDEVPSKGFSTQLPLVKRGMAPDSLSVMQTIYHQELGIIGGLPTNITSHPYQVAIDYGKTFVCAGALLNRIWAVTLASCAAGAAPLDLTVRIGSDSNLHGGTVLNVTEIVVHPNYNYSNLDYDFALLKFNTYLCFNQFSQAINFSPSKPPSEVHATVSGWGTKQGWSLTSQSSNFSELSMRIMTQSACQKLYLKSNDNITSRMFCAVAGNKGPCHNDFGDPLVVNGTLFGLYSWSRGCSSSTFPAVFSNLAYVKEWIYTTLNNACTCGVY